MAKSNTPALQASSRVLLTKEVLTVLYYWGGYTMQEIADMFGLTREGVRQKMEKFGLKRFTQRARHKDFFGRGK